MKGINAVLYYSTELFSGAGLARESAKYATIGKSHEFLTSFQSRWTI